MRISSCWKLMPTIPPNSQNIPFDPVLLSRCANFLEQFFGNRPWCLFFAHDTRNERRLLRPRRRYRWNYVIGRHHCSLPSLLSFLPSFLSSSISFSSFYSLRGHTRKDKGKRSSIFFFSIFFRENARKRVNLWNWLETGSSICENKKKREREMETNIAYAKYRVNFVRANFHTYP